MFATNKNILSPDFPERLKKFVGHCWSSVAVHLPQSVEE
jgi:hypothetical protein